jgi:hypothetical protein
MESVRFTGIKSSYGINLTLSAGKFGFAMGHTPILLDIRSIRKGLRYRVVSLRA